MRLFCLAAMCACWRIASVTLVIGRVGETGLLIISCVGGEIEIGFGGGLNFLIDFGGGVKLGLERAACNFAW